MVTIFHYDNKFFEGINKLADCILISILWLVFSIPVITAGAAATAAYYTVCKVLKEHRGYVWRSFKEAFRTNFKQATVLWLVCLLAGIFLAVDIYIARLFLENSEVWRFLFYIFMISLVFLILWSCYLFAYTARFENTTKEILLNCSILAAANLPKTILLFLILLAGVFLGISIPFMFLILPALVMWAMSGVLESIFRNYMPEENLR